MSPEDIIIKPIVTEKSNMDLQEGKYTFKVAKKATKIQIAEAVEKLFNVKVLKVNTISVQGKSKRVGYHQGRTSDWKKAIVTIDTNPTDKTYLAEGGKVKKTFFYNEPLGAEDEKDLVLLEIDNGRATLNWGMLKDNKFLISDQPSTVDYKMLYSETPAEYTDIKYTPNFKRPISIIDPEIGDEVKPVLFYDDEANTVKAKIKMAPNKPYIALEVK